MKRIRTEMSRYGEPDFDSNYAKWGFHDKETPLKPVFYRPQNAQKISTLYHQ